MKRLLLAAIGAASALVADDLPFRVSTAGEVVAEIEMRSPGSDWGSLGREAAVATVTLDRRGARHVMLFAGAERHTYRIFLGELAPGNHELSIETNTAFSSAGLRIEVLNAAFTEYGAGSPDASIVANAPVLFARRNTIGKFSDIPLMTYCERLQENGLPLLQYTVIFSNEDGGTSTRALMARWGRATDIEYVYKAFLDSRGRASRATIQSRDHHEIEYSGPREGTHPLLIPVTDNNMVAGEGPSPLRYQPAPVLVDLSRSSREKVMDDHPIAWRVMAQELRREGKLRAFDAVDGEKIGDPRNYLYIEARIANQAARTVAIARLHGENKWRTADLGRNDYGIERSGWIRTAIELRPGTIASRVAEIGFACRVENTREIAGVFRIDRVSKAFFLDEGYRPGASLWSLSAPREIKSGEVLTFEVGSRPSERSR